MPRRCFVFFANSEMLEVYKTIVKAFDVCAQEMGISLPEPKPVAKTRSSISRDKTPTPPSMTSTPSTSKNLNQAATVIFSLKKTNCYFFLDL